MKIYGRCSGLEDVLEMSEVSIVASGKELRRVADFLYSKADLIDSGNFPDHAHYSDFSDDRRCSVDIIILDENI